MAGTQLINQLRTEINNYLGIPYFSNTGKHKTSGENVLVGKGTAKEIALQTVEYANKENIKIINLTSKQIYNFQKKHHLGIDCSGLVSHLLNYYSVLLGKDININPRNTSAQTLTSPPFSKSVNFFDITTGDLVRQKLGRHVIFVISRNLDDIYYVESSKTKRGVNLGTVKLNNPDFFKDGVFRPTFLL